MIESFDRRFEILGSIDVDEDLILEAIDLVDGDGTEKSSHRPIVAIETTTYSWSETASIHGAERLASSEGERHPRGHR